MDGLSHTQGRTHKSHGFMGNHRKQCPVCPQVFVANSSPQSKAMEIQGAAPPQDQIATISILKVLDWILMEIQLGSFTNLCCCSSDSKVPAQCLYHTVAAACGFCTRWHRIWVSGKGHKMGALQLKAPKGGGAPGRYLAWAVQLSSSPCSSLALPCAPPCAPP